MENYLILLALANFSIANSTTPVLSSLEQILKTLD